MEDKSNAIFNAIFAFGFFLFGFGFGISLMKYNMRTQAIEAGVAHYDAKTGDFTWDGVK